MNDYMLLEYLKGGEDYYDHELLDEFKHFMRARGRMKGSKRDKDYHMDDVLYNRHDWDMHDHENYHAKYAKGYTDSFDEYTAKELVSNMYHIEMNKKHEGEHFDMNKAEEVYHKYKDSFAMPVSPCDVYVAINAAYHDFGKTLKMWFGTNIDEKVIILAIAFWFKDEDYQGNKIMNYFN